MIFPSIWESANNSKQKLLYPHLKQFWACSLLICSEDGFFMWLDTMTKCPKAIPCQSFYIKVAITLCQKYTKKIWEQTKHMPLILKQTTCNGY